MAGEQFMEPWYYEPLRTMPQMPAGGYIDMWDVQPDGAAWISILDFDPSILDRAETRFIIADRLNDMGVATDTGSSSGYSVERPTFEVVLPDTHRGWSNTRVVVRSRRLTDAQSMFLCGLKERKKEQTVVEYLDEIRVLGTAAIGNPTFGEELQQYLDDLELDKNPFFDVRYLQFDERDYASTENLYENLAQFPEAKSLAADFRTFKSLAHKLKSGNATTTDRTKFMELLKSLDEDLAVINLKLKLEHPEGVNVDEIEDDPRYVQFDFMIPKPDDDFYELTKVEVAKLKPEYVSSLGLYLRRTASYRQARADSVTRRIASSGSTNRPKGNKRNHRPRNTGLF